METVALLLLMMGFPLLVLANLYLTRSKDFGTRHIVTLSEDALTEETPYSKREVKWAAVHKVGLTRQHIFLYTARNAAHVIPRRAVFDDEECQAFWQFCQRRFEDEKR